MPRPCSCCQHRERTAIDEALVRRDSFRGIARRFAISPDAVERHAKAHLPAAIVKAKEVEDVANGDALLAQIQDLQKRTLAILTSAEKDDARTALVAIHQARENVALLSKLLAGLRPADGKGSLNFTFIMPDERARLPLPTPRTPPLPAGMLPLPKVEK